VHGEAEAKGIGMQNRNILKVTRFSLLAVAGLIVVVVCLLLVVGYGAAFRITLGAVPEYFAKCHPGWNLTSWYEHDDLYIPVDDLQRYLAKGCPEVEPRNAPEPAEYISNSVFLFFQRNLDRWYFIGYRAGVDSVIQTILPTWNWTFKNHTWVRKGFVLVLGLIALGVIAGLRYILFSRVS
jgi:hypothetical protein